jgi:hypothetical protein
VKEQNDATRALADAGPEAVAIIFVNLTDVTQCSAINRFMCGIDAISSRLVLVPHSTHRQYRAPDTETRQFKVISSFLQLGFDEVVIGEPQGFRLAAEVRARLRCFDQRSLNSSDAQRMLAVHDHANFLRTTIEDVLWKYLSKRLQVGIPDVDHYIAPGEPHLIHNFEFEGILGRGAYGKVFKVNDIGSEHDHPGPRNLDIMTEDSGSGVRSTCDDGSATQQVMKCIAKRDKTVTFMKSLKNEIVVMTCLSTEWSHPSIPKLYELYHSQTHIFLRMEYGGPENLQRRLCCRDFADGTPRELSQKKVASIISQCLAALAFLHTGPKVVHRDIKPANVIISETEAGARIFLSDFGLARFAAPHLRSSHACGTLPFMAPETVLQPSFNLFAADVWSMGVLCLDVLCSEGFVQRRVFKETHTSRNKMKKVQLMQCLHQYFASSVSRAIAEHIRCEYHSLSTGSTVMLNGMLDVVESRRTFVEQAAAQFEHSITA